MNIGIQKVSIQDIHSQFANAIDMPVTPESNATGVSVTPTFVTQVGDPIDFGHFTNTGTHTADLTNGKPVKLTTRTHGNMPLLNHSILLRAGRLYEMFGSVPVWFAASSGGVGFQFYDVTNSAYIGAAVRHATSSWDGNAYKGGIATAVIRPDVDSWVQLRIVEPSVALASIGEEGAKAVITVHQLDPRAMHYTWGATQVEVRKKSTGIVVFDSGEVANLSVTLTGSLEASTEYEWRARHKENAGYWMKWSEWRTFTTA